MTEMNVTSNLDCPNAVEMRVADVKPRDQEYSHTSCV